MGVDETAFRVEDRVLWPVVCPACGYSLQGLPEPRCPECGERAAEGEVVIVGLQYRNRGAAITGEFWGREMIENGVYVAIAVMLLLYLHGPSWETIVACGLMFMLMSGLITLAWLHGRRRGWPSGVLRLSARGYRIGAGERVGRLHPWSRKIEVKAVHRKDFVRLRGVKSVGSIPLRNVFDIAAVCSEEQVAGILERVARWNPREDRVFGR